MRVTFCLWLDYGKIIKKERILCTFVNVEVHPCEGEEGDLQAEAANLEKLQRNSL